MATIPLKLTVHSPKILQGGHVLRLHWAIAPKPASTSWTDWRLGWATGARVTMSGGRTLTPIIVNPVYHSLPYLSAKASTGAASTLAAGKYTFRFAIADADGNIVDVSNQSGDWSSTTPWTAVLAGQQILFRWFDVQIPEGYTGRIYAANTTDSSVEDAASDLRLLRTDIPAGTETLILTDFTFADAGLALPPVFSMVGFFKIPEDQLVEFGEVVTVSADAGVLTDVLQGHVSAAIVDQPVTNLSKMGSNGLTATTFTRSSTGVTMYVSGTYGSDANPGTLESPKATVNAAFLACPISSGSVVRIRRGETHTLTTGINTRNGPSDPSKPFICESYWDAHGSGDSDPGISVRPIISLIPSAHVWSISPGYNMGNALNVCNNMLFRNIEFYYRDTDPLTANRGKMTWTIGVRNIMLSDCKMNGVFVNASCETGTASFDFELHRCIVVDSNTPSGHRQGLFGKGIMNLAINQTVFHRNGFAGAGQDEIVDENHNFYAAFNTDEFVGTDSWFLESSGLAGQPRGGGGFYRCIAIGHQQGFETRNGPFHVHDCVSGGFYGVRGGQVVSNGPDNRYDIIQNINEGVLCAHVDLDSAYGNIATPGRTFSASSGSLYQVNRVNAPREYVVLRNCTGHDVTRSWRQSGFIPKAKMIVARNLFQPTATLPSGYQVEISATNSSGLSTWLEDTENVYYTPQSAFIQVVLAGVNQGAKTLAQYQSLYGVGLTSNVITTPVTFVDGAADLGDWNAYNGGTNTVAALHTVLRARGAGVWGDVYDANLCYLWYRAQYKTGDLANPAPGTGLWDYIGFSDNRTDPIPIFYTIDGLHTGYTDEAINLTITPDSAPNRSLTFECVGLTGTFSPTTAAWTDSSTATRSFSFTPTQEGAGTIRALDSGSPVASHEITVIDRPELGPRPSRTFGSRRAQILGTR